MEREATRAIPAHDSHQIFRFIFIILIAACAAVVAVTWIAYLLSRERVELDVSTCRLVPAIVLGKGQSIRQHGSVSLPVYHVRYSIPFNGKQLEGLATVSRDHYAWIRAGDSTPAYVNMTDPARHFLKLERNAMISRRARPACVAAAIGVAIACLNLLANQRHRIPAY